jgi:hypothetical protein
MARAKVRYSGGVKRTAPQNPTPSIAHLGCVFSILIDSPFPLQDKPPASASAWHRPFVAEDAKEILAQRQAQAAITLLRLGQADGIWPLLKYSPDPRLRTRLLHLFGPLGVEPEALLRRLDEASDVSARRALVLGLGEFPEKLGMGTRQSLVARLQDAYRNDPDQFVLTPKEWRMLPPISFVVPPRWVPRPRISHEHRCLPPHAGCSPLVYSQHLVRSRSTRSGADADTSSGD